MRVFLFAVVFLFGFSVCFPLQTNGRWIVDERGKRVKLACASWYGAEEKDYIVAGLEKASIDQIAREIKSFGFNCVRIPWSNEMLEKNPIITNETIIAANKNFLGQTPLDVLDAMVRSLASNKVMVILDNHMSDANWCCSETDGNGLWYNTRFSESQWINDWVNIIRRYQNQPYVIGADIRNELRKSCDWGSNDCRVPVWGGNNPSLDWHRAATECGNAILKQNPNILIIIEGLNYALDLTNFGALPVKLNLPNRVVYSAHDYSFDHGDSRWYSSHFFLADDGENYSIYELEVITSWGYLITPGQNFTAPVWLGEFGTCHTGESCYTGWWSNVLKYLSAYDFDWSYWAIDGTHARADGIAFGSEEVYGVFNIPWNAPASLTLLKSLQGIMNATQGP